MHMRGGRDDAAADWIDANQLARRNLSPDQMALLRGRRYERLKKARGGDRRSKCHNDTLKTAASLGEEHGVGESTILRNAKFARAVDKLKTVDPDIERPAAQERKREAISAARKAANSRDGDNLSPSQPQRDSLTRERVGKAIGMSGTTYEHAKRVVRDGVPELVAAMDEGEVSVDRADKRRTRDGPEYRTADCVAPEHRGEIRGGDA